MDRLAAVAFAVAVVLQPVHAQPEPDEPRRPIQSQFLFYDAVTLYSRDTSLVRVDIHYRINTDFFVTVRNTESALAGEYERHGVLVADLLDSTRMARGHGVQNIEIADNVSERSPTDIRWYQGILSFNVPRGTYTIAFDLSDQESRRSFSDKKRTLVATLPPPESLRCTTAFFVADTVGIHPGEHLVPQNFGGDALYWKPGSIYLEMPGSQDTATTIDVDYVFRSAEPSADKAAPVVSGTRTGLRPLRSITLMPEGAGDSTSYAMRGDSTRQASSLLIPLPMERLPLRAVTLQLTLHRGNDTTTINKEFRLLWPDMPLSLRNVDFALEALQYIVSEEQLDSLKDGNFETRMRNLENFWQKRDKTPETPSNEVMTEYYRRVDEATRNLGSLRRPDGFRTDRGRIYVLYGPPTRTDRNLDPQGTFQEIWIYERLRKKFIFEDRGRTGDYVLAATGAL
jgi:GWxTD domain-containing protein